MKAYNDTVENNTTLNGILKASVYSIFVFVFGKTKRIIQETIEEIISSYLKWHWKLTMHNQGYHRA